MEGDKRKYNLENSISKWGIHLGVPIVSKDFRRVIVPKFPHVFFLQKIRFLEDEKSIAELNHVMVMLGHAVVLGKSLDDWKFLGSQMSVESTVKAYEASAKQFKEPSLDVVLACREDAIVNKDAKVKVIFSRRSNPYIVPSEGKVTLKPPSPGESFMWLTEGSGVSLIVADAHKWGYIDEWLRYKNANLDGRTRDIPDWAVKSA